MENDKNIKKLHRALSMVFKLKSGDAGAIEITDEYNDTNDVFGIKINIESISFGDYGDLDPEMDAFDMEINVFKDMESRMMKVADDVDTLVRNISPGYYNSDIITDYPYVILTYELN